MKIYDGKKCLIVSDSNLKSMKDLEQELEKDNDRQSKLEYANLCFNQIVSLSSISEIDLKYKGLRFIDISHNELRNLNGIETLLHLEVLICSFNLLSNISPLCKCINLKELWIQNNRLKINQIHEFQYLKHLNTLLIHPNPCTQLATYKLLLVGLLSSLTNLDLVSIPDNLKERSHEFLLGQEGRQLCKSAQIEILNDSSLKIKTTEIIKTKNNKQIYHKTVSRHQKTIRSNNNSNVNIELSAKEIKPFNLEDFPVQQFIDLSGKQTDFSSNIESNLTSSIDDEPQASSSEVKMTSTISIMDAVVGLPLFSKLESSTKEKIKIKDKNQVESKTKNAQNLETESVCDLKTLPIYQSNNEEIQEEYKINYPSHGALAFQISSNGNALCKWSNGNIAIAVNQEYPGYRIYASHLDGKIACSFDSYGIGFINYFPSGKTMITTSSTGGMFLSENGKLMKEWNIYGNVVNDHGESCGLDSIYRLNKHIAVECFWKDGEVVDEKKTKKLQVYVYFNYKNIRQRFIQGYNIAKADESDCNPIFGIKQKKIKIEKIEVSNEELLESIRQSIVNLE